MTTKNHFELNVRKEDLLNLYSDQITFKLFSKEYAGRIFFIAVASMLGLITVISSFYDSQYIYYSLIFIAGIVYCVYDIRKSYHSKRIKKQSVEVWADDVLEFKTHQLIINDEALVYRRDEESFTYPFDRIHIHSAPTYFQILVNDGSELLIPKNAFSNDEHELFFEAINERIKQSHDDKTLV